MSERTVFDANPAMAVSSESPLAISRVTVATVNTAERAGVVVREAAFLGHLMLRGSVADPGFVAGVERALGVALPVDAGDLSFDARREVSLQWMSPDEWLLIVPGGAEFDAELRLHAELTGHYAVINVSGGQTVLELRGPAVAEVLMKCTGYDVDPARFAVGRGVGTTFAKTTALIRRVAEQRWQLVIRRSFADYIYRWLLDASEEFGVHVARKPT
jgi:sarcosine oxidase subunit gamma